jgi:membrane protein DedA with SNARE-associated domain
MMNKKLMASWIIGGFFLLLGMLIIKNLDLVVGVTELSYVVTLLIAFIFVLLAGFFWMSATSTKKKE